MLKTYTDREGFLNVLLDGLERAKGCKVVFGKYSPAPLPVNSKIILALQKILDCGGELLMIIRQSSDNDVWVEPVYEMLISKGAKIAVCKEDCIYFPPILVINSNEVFMHINWSTNKIPTSPYLGIHLTGKEVEVLADTLRSTIEITVNTYST